jgi:Fe-S oxidoreductase
VISFARFVADRLPGVVTGAGDAGPVTLQEACKVSYLELDPQAPRELVKLATGMPVREMDRHGTGTVCCGWSLHSCLPAIGDEDRRQRLAEAAATGADKMVTVCHGCQWVMDIAGDNADISVVNYVSLVGKVLGIHHEERFREIRKLGDLEKVIDSIRQRMDGRFEQVPYDQKRIREAVKSLLGGFYQA